MKYTDKQTHLRQLDENEFRLNIIIPLFMRMPGHESVHDNHGAGERGIDVALLLEDLHFGVSCIGVVLKKGKISGAASSSTLLEIETQIKMAKRNRIAFLDKGISVKPKGLIFATTGSVSHTATAHIEEVAKEEPSLTIRIYQESDIIKLIDDYYSEYWLYSEIGATDYYSTLRKQYSIFSDITKLGISKEINFDTIYVPMQLEEVIDEKTITVEHIDGTPLRRPNRKRLSDKDLLEDGRQIFVLGESGAGKKTLLKRILLEQIERNLADPREEIVPVIVDCKEFFGSKKSVKKYLIDYLIKNSGTQIASDFDSVIANKGFLLLLDNLSRIGNKEDFLQTVEKFSEYIKPYPRCKIIATIRDNMAAEADELVNFNRYEIQPFSNRQVFDLVTNWYSANTKENIEQLVDQLVKNVIQCSLPRTPLVYTLNLVLLDNENKALNLADLFEKYVDLYLGKWSEELHQQAKFDFKLKRRVLSEIAYSMITDKGESLNVGEIYQIITNYLDRIGRNFSPEEILQEIVNSGILKRESNSVTFSLYALQEFFSGYYIYLQENSQKFAIEKLEDRAWGQPIVYLAGLRRECDLILEEIVTRKEINEVGKQFYLSHMAGILASNADQSNNELKLESIKYSLFGYSIFMRRICEILRHIYGNVGELYGGFLIETLAFYGMGSAALVEQYKTLLKSHNLVEETVAKEFEFSQTELVFQKLIVISLLRRVGESSYIDHLEGISNLNDPYICLHILQIVNDILDDPDEEEHMYGNEAKLKKIKTKMQRRLRENRTETQRILSKDKTKQQLGYILPSKEEFLSRPQDYSDI